MNEKGACMQWNRYNLLTEILFFIRGCVCIYIYRGGQHLSDTLRLSFLCCAIVSGLLFWLV